MNTSLFVVVAVLLGGSLTSFAATLKASARQSSPFVCRMDALSAKERAELPEIFDKLIAMHPLVSELKNGYRIVFPQANTSFDLASRWISCESRCCAFFEFGIGIAPNNGPLTITMTGPAGVKDFIAGDLPKLHALTTAHT